MSSNKEKKQFSEIMFTLSSKQKDEEIRAMGARQKDKFKRVLAQKIINDTTRKYIPPPKEEQTDFTFVPTKPGFLATVCFCLYPEENRNNFDITSKVFLRRFFGVFLICKSNFLKFGIPKIKKGKRMKDDPNDNNPLFGAGPQTEVDADGRNNTPDLYGPLWLTVSYIIILSICANLNDYFAQDSPDSYVFNTQYVQEAALIVLIFVIAETLIYKAVIGCLKGYMTSPEVILCVSEHFQSLTLIGYSLILYFIPTIFCVIPSLLVHFVMLAVGGGLRAIFLFRNYGKFLESKRQLMLFTFIGIEALFWYILQRTLFVNNRGYAIADGTDVVFNHDMSDVGLHLRRFDDSFY